MPENGWAAIDVRARIARDAWLMKDCERFS